MTNDLCESEICAFEKICIEPNSKIRLNNHENNNNACETNPLVVFFLNTDLQLVFAPSVIAR